VLVLVALAALLINDGRGDTSAWRATRWLMGSQDAYQWETYKRTPAPGVAWYRTVEPPLHGGLYKRTEKIWRVLRDLGEPLVTVVLLAAVWIYLPDRRRPLAAAAPLREGGAGPICGRWRASAALLAATLLAGGVGALIRFSTGRLRPNGIVEYGVANEGENVWECFRTFARTPHFPYFSIGGGDLSFPSGHATLAFATAAALSYLSPRGRWLFLALATGTALSRVVMQAHFYSDVIFGAALGYTLGYWAVRAVDQAFGRGR
jgi:membrane-associated phospholipid phosphatase